MDAHAIKHAAKADMQNALRHMQSSMHAAKAEHVAKADMGMRYVKRVTEMQGVSSMWAR